MSRWTREELVMAMNLYCQIPFGRQHSRAPEVVELAKMIGRSPGSVAMKLNNLASIDPAERERGIKGLANASQSDRQVWAEFESDWERLAIESEALRQALGKSTSADSKVPEPVLDMITETDRKQKVRVAQGFFRRMVLASYRNQCCVTGNPIPELLVASHILPWATHPEERVNPRNGLCLSRLHDTAFDQGLISFDGDGQLLLSRRLKGFTGSKTLRENFTRYEGQKMKLPEKFHPDEDFLAWHRDTIFQGE